MPEVKPRVSVIMITGNVIARTPGRAIFERVLQSAAWADELVIVDSESTDGTREAARAYTERIYVHPFENSFKRQKQRALDYATGEWVLSLDADEVLPEELSAEIRAAVQSGEANAYRIVRQHYFIGRILRHAGEDAPIRLWRRGVGAWAAPDVHEHYEVPGPVGKLKTPLEHYSTASLSGRLYKTLQFAQASAAQAETPARAEYTAGDVWRQLLRPPLARFYGVYWVERGWRDGVRGFLWAAISAISEFYHYMLVWEKAAASGIPGLRPAAPVGRSPSNRLEGNGDQPRATSTGVGESTRQRSAGESETR